MLFCRCREGVRVELALRLAPGIHGYGPNGVKIGLILPRLFEFSEMVKIMTFSYTVFSGECLHRHVVRQVVRYGGRGQPTASGSGRCLPETSSRGSEDAGNGRRAERSAAE